MALTQRKTCKNWHYSPEEAVGCSLESYLAGLRSARSKSTSTLQTSSPPDSSTSISPTSPSGRTSKPSTDALGEASLMSSLEVSHVKTSAAPGNAEGSMELAAVSGTKCCESLAKFGLRGSLPKTARTSALEDWVTSSKGLPTWGIVARGECSELITLVRRTNGGGCGLLPTPTTQGNELSPSMAKWPAHARLQAMLPTSYAKTYGYNKSGAAGHVGKARPSLETQAKDRGLGQAVLTLREWMMGWPIGWTALEPLETDRFRQWQQQHGGCYHNA